MTVADIIKALSKLNSNAKVYDYDNPEFFISDITVEEESCYGEDIPDSKIFIKLEEER